MRADKNNDVKDDVPVVFSMFTSFIQVDANLLNKTMTSLPSEAEHAHASPFEMKSAPRCIDPHRVFWQTHCFEGPANKLNTKEIISRLCRLTHPACIPTRNRQSTMPPLQRPRQCIHAWTTPHLTCARKLTITTHRVVFVRSRDFLHCVCELHPDRRMNSRAVNADG